MMTLDEAIHHAEEVAKECEEHICRHPDQLAYTEKFYDAEECAKEHRQLAEWLKEFKYCHKLIDVLLEFLEGFESDHPCEMMHGKDYWCEVNCDYEFPTKDCWLHYVDFLKGENDDTKI